MMSVDLITVSQTLIQIREPSCTTYTYSIYSKMKMEDFFFLRRMPLVEGGLLMDRVTFYVLPFLASRYIKAKHHIYESPQKSFAVFHARATERHLVR